MLLLMHIVQMEALSPQTCSLKRIESEKTEIRVFKGFYSPAEEAPRIKGF